jgi:hypothetical protein
MIILLLSFNRLLIIIGLCNNEFNKNMDLFNLLKKIIIKPIDDFKCENIFGLGHIEIT